jgi:hypothetical protein
MSFSLDRFFPVPGFSKYWIDEDGLIYSEFTHAFIKPQPNIKDYPRVTLYNGHGPEKKFVHRLVAEVFKENPDPKTMDQVNHIDYDVTNFKASNLEWCTQSHNQKHARKKPWRQDAKKFIDKGIDCPF